MVEPRYSPRDYCQRPKSFGKEGVMGWVAAAAENRVNLRAAQLQHLYVVRIRAGMDARGMNLKSYAAAVNCKYDRMSKLLRGVHPMRLDDIAAADLALGDISEWEANVAAGATPTVPDPLAAPIG